MTKRKQIIISLVMVVFLLLEVATRIWKDMYIISTGLRILTVILLTILVIRKLKKYLLVTYEMLITLIAVELDMLLFDGKNQLIVIVQISNILINMIVLANASEQKLKKEVTKIMDEQKKKNEEKAIIEEMYKNW